METEKFSKLFCFRGQLVLELARSKSKGFVICKQDAKIIMAHSSSESLIMTLLEQIRVLEDERDKALQLANQLEARENCRGNMHIATANEDNVSESSRSSINSEETDARLEKLREENEALKGTVESMTQTLIFDLEEIRLNEEQRKFNLKELVNEPNDDQSSESEEMDADGYRTMLDMCKKYYGKMVAELQEERVALQQRIEKQQALLLEKDIKITELETKLQKVSKKAGSN